MDIAAIAPARRLLAFQFHSYGNGRHGPLPVRSGFLLEPWPCQTSNQASRVIAAGVHSGKRLQPSGARLQFAVPVIAVIFDNVLHEIRLLDRLTEIADEPAVDDRM